MRSECSLSSMATQRPTHRVPMDERREQILEAALLEFSHKGLRGGSTMNIAREVGISQPNIFRIFSTKHELFVAVLQRVFQKIEATMLAAGESTSGEPLYAMSDAWGELMEEREIMFMLLQGYAASDDAMIRDLMRAGRERCSSEWKPSPASARTPLTTSSQQACSTWSPQPWISPPARQRMRGRPDFWPRGRDGSRLRPGGLSFFDPSVVTTH